jgi:hypothetical protein
MGTGTSSGTPGKKDRRSVNSSESARGSGEEKGDEGYKSDDTADMSAIPPDQNNQNESLESMSMDLNLNENENDIGENGNDSNGFLSDSDIDRASEKKGSSGKKGRKDSRSGSRSSAKPNRRVSFGEGTKEHMEGEGDEEAVGEGEEDDVLPANESFAVEFDDDNNGTDDNLESSGLGSRRSSVSTTPVSRSRVSSSSGGKYSMGETPGSNEFTR